MDILNNMYKAAADAMMGQQPPMAGGMGGQPGQPQPQPGMMDPNGMGMMPPPPDPVEEDNGKINSLIQNLQLRTQLLQAQQELAAAQDENQEAGVQESPIDPDTGEPISSNPALRAAAEQIKATAQSAPKPTKKSENMLEGKEEKPSTTKNPKSTTPATTPEPADASVSPE